MRQQKVRGMVSIRAKQQWRKRRCAYMSLGHLGELGGLGREAWGLFDWYCTIEQVDVVWERLVDVGLGGGCGVR
jgi:hypothetical protein